MLLALFLSACSLGDKEAQGRQITRSLDPLRSRGAVAGVSSWFFTVKELTLGAVSDFATFQRRLAPYATAFVADIGSNTAQAGPTDKPVAVYAGDVVYVRRSGAGSGLSSREWSRLDFGDVERPRSPGVQAVADNLGPPTATLLNPAHLFQLVTGALTGSVKRLGVETVGKVATTHYKANLSMDNAERELDLKESDRDNRRAALTALAVKGDIVPAEVWIDGDGALRRLQLTFTQRPARRATLAFVVRLEIVERGGGRPAAAPTRREYVRVESASELVRGLRSVAAPTPTTTTAP